MKLKQLNCASKGDKMRQDKLKEFRVSKGLTQEQLARELRITLSMYYQIESGKTGVSGKFMRKLKALYPDANIDALFFS